MKKLILNKKGFTLVELIVVIAIIGILSAVLIPSVTSYIGKAKESAALQEAEHVEGAYRAFLVELEINEDLEFPEFYASDFGGDATSIKSGETAGDENYLDNFYFIAGNGLVVKFTISGSTIKSVIDKEVVWGDLN